MMKHRLIQGIGWLALIFLLYIIIGGTVVPLFRPHRKAVSPVHLDSLGTNSERVLCIDDNQQALLWRLRVIDSAKADLVFATFKLKDDESGRDVMAAIMDAAERGVNVRMVVDGFSTFVNLRHNAHFDALAAHPNVEVKIYNPVNFWMPWKLNYRMHDKYLVADNTAYILGGRNTQNMSLGNYQQDKDIDRDVLVYGTRPDPNGSLMQVRRYFETIWNQKDVKTITAGKKQDKEGLLAHYQTLKERYPEAYAPISWKETTYPAQGIRLIHNEPGARNKSPILWDMLVDLMGQGQHCMIQTPYMMCNSAMYRDLERINAPEQPHELVLNSVETGANLCGCVDYLTEKNRILDTGLRIYEYVGANSSHAKTVLIDGRVSVVGSFNFDMRSAYLDTETMLVIDSPELCAHLEEVVRQEMDMGREALENGEYRYGKDYQEIKAGPVKMALYHLMRIVVLPFRHLL